MNIDAIHIYTIGFTRKSAQDFFTKLRNAGVKRVIDTRLNNVSQLAGFTKKEDLRFFLDRIGHIDYVHLTELAPTQDILDAFKREKGSWQKYEESFLALMEKRRVESTIPRELLNQACLLCSEQTPEHCHRRLVAEYFRKHWEKVEVTHIL